MRGGILICCEQRRKSHLYARGLTLLGVSPDRIQVITPEDRQEEIRLLAAQAAGLMLCGGPDLEPWRYGEDPDPNAGLKIVPELDRLEMELLAGAEEARTPVWAICRGMQAVNVFQGGTLWQDIRIQIDDAVDHDVREPLDALAHSVEVVLQDDSFGRLLARAETRVNSRHHQAIKALGKDLAVVAESPDGLIEVLAHSHRDWWLRGVQWHPENLLHIEVQRLMWAEFVQTATKEAHER